MKPDNVCEKCVVLYSLPDTTLILDGHLCFLVTFHDLYRFAFFCLNFCFLACCCVTIFLLLRLLQTWHFF